MIFPCDDAWHMICISYSVENLHRMAETLEIKRHWFHKDTKPHYDIPKRRIEEISKKCVKISSSQIVTIIVMSKDSTFNEAIISKFQRNENDN